MRRNGNGVPCGPAGYASRRASRYSVDERLPRLRVVGEGGQDRPQTGSLDPVQDRVLALQQMRYVVSHASTSQPRSVSRPGRPGRVDGVVVAQGRRAALPAGAGEFAHQPWLGESKLPGTWKAKVPPGARPAIQSGNAPGAPAPTAASHC